MTVLEFDAKHRIRERFNNCALNEDRVVLGLCYGITTWFGTFAGIGSPCMGKAGNITRVAPSETIRGDPSNLRPPRGLKVEGQQYS